MCLDTLDSHAEANHVFRDVIRLHMHVGPLPDLARTACNEVLYRAPQCVEPRSCKGNVLVFHACFCQLAVKMGKAFQNGATRAHAEVG